MQDVHEIEDNLRVIRRLMERGRRYEAITGRGALLAGVAALVVAGLVQWLAHASGFGRAWGFLIAWPALALACAAGLLRAGLRIPARPNDVETERLSSAARAVGRAVLPAYVLSAALTLAALSTLHVMILPGAWAALHGIAILATAYHAPRRLVILGWIFLLSGAGMLAAIGLFRLQVPPNLAMAITFGGLHLGYGLYSVLRPLPSEG